MHQQQVPSWQTSIRRSYKNKNLETTQQRCRNDTVYMLRKRNKICLHGKNLDQEICFRKLQWTGTHQM
jgi:hypothetical protein